MTVADEKPFHNPFGVLAGLRESLPKEPASATRSIPRAVIRIERSGRGGKEVTIVEHLAIGPSEREAWLKALKSGLGCGGQIEGDTLVLQGDQRKRLPALLTARGVKRIVVS